LGLSKVHNPEAIATLDNVCNIIWWAIIHKTSLAEASSHCGEIYWYRYLSDFISMISRASTKNKSVLVLSPNGLKEGSLQLSCSYGYFVVEFLKFFAHLFREKCNKKVCNARHTGKRATGFYFTTESAAL